MIRIMSNSLKVSCIIWVFVTFFYNKSNGQSFIDIAPLQNIAHTVNSSLAIGGSGVSFYDFDNDGWDDITFVQVDDSILFYKNVNGSFQLLPSFIFSPGETKQLLWVDYDNDGDNDAMLVTHIQPLRLFNNDGNFNFTDVTTAAGLMGLNSKNYGVTFADYDRDGYLDFYLSRYYNIAADPLDPQITNALYRNNGDGTFENVTITAGVGNGVQPTFMGVWIDINHDLWPDLYVINDRLLWGNSLYVNNGDGTFSDITESSGAGMFGEDPMGATFDDFDNDGDIDILCSNGGPPTKPIRLYVNQGNNTFVEMAQQLNISVNITFHCTWGASWVDVNNDTYNDLYITTGLLTLNAENEKRSFLFMSDGAETFTDSPLMFQSEHLAASYAVAKGDINNDGYPDLVVQNAKNFNSFIWANQVPPELTNRFIKITLEGTSSNRMAVGSWITLYVEGQQYTHYTRCGENYISQDSQHHIFGLGSAALVDSIRVEYPSGHIDNYYNLPVNQSYLFKEGDSYSAHVSANITAICQGDSALIESGEHFMVTWNNGLTDAAISVNEAGEYWFLAQNEFGVVTMSDTIVIDVLPNPEITIQTLNPFCSEESTGVIWLENEIEVETLLVSWSNEMQGEMIDSLAAGNYYFDFIDVNGCSAIGLAQLIEPDAMLVQVFTTPDLGDGDGAIMLNINGGSPPYQVYVNGVLESVNISNLAGGTYAIEVIDFNGCSYQTTAIIDMISLIAAANQNLYVSVYPNPSDGIFNVSCADKIDSIQLMDVTGQLIPVFVGQNNQITLDLNSYAKGIYLLEINTLKKIYRTRIVLK
jgi:hypothetical protein